MEEDGTNFANGSVCVRRLIIPFGALLEASREKAKMGTNKTLHPTAG
jgi:hypothetical protein